MHCGKVVFDTGVQMKMLQELYKDICQFRCQPEVAVMMFSEALRQLDENTVKYMIEEQKKEIEENKKVIEKQAGEIEKQAERIAELERLSAEKK